VFEDGENLRGRYRARYVVPDRAISPEVAFTFQGTAGSTVAELPWVSGGGAEGSIRLELLSENKLDVKWFARNPGKSMGLAYGQAVLVRRLEP